MVYTTDTMRQNIIRSFGSIASLEAKRLARAQAKREVKGGKGLPLGLQSLYKNLFFGGNIRAGAPTPTALSVVGLMRAIMRQLPIFHMCVQFPYWVAEELETRSSHLQTRRANLWTSVVRLQW